METSEGQENGWTHIESTTACHLVLEDGTRFDGHSFGAPFQKITGEVGEYELMSCN